MAQVRAPQRQVAGSEVMEVLPIGQAEKAKHHLGYLVLMDVFQHWCMTINVVMFCRLARFHACRFHIDST